jgi:hypothetical protein
MRIDSLIKPMMFADVPNGTFFKAMRGDEGFFGLKVARKVGASLAAMIFHKIETQIGTPWIAHGDFNDAIAAMPDALIRPDFKSAKASDGNFPFGVMIATQAGTLMKASDGIGQTAFFNIETGEETSLPGTRPLIVYSRWAVGHAVYNAFEPTFSFPIAISQTTPLNI